MTPLQHTIENLKHRVQSTEHQAERTAVTHATKALAKQQAATAAMVAQHQKDLGQLQQDLADVHRRSSGGHFPWAWLILAGGAYALYRSNPAVREQVQDLLGRVKNAGEDAMTAVKEGDTSGAQGEARPLAVVEQVAAELEEKSRRGDAAEEQGR
ncbi:hypothetical protein [Deinococcus ficus]|uniref:Uncharacterized protein n=1 Tax=Deinococcus ficus TaxID=317577 RepID=A0A221T069_9DEIO|nr:hypothetical protein [Deinococcus ficus]ASN82307.1 hypothetical protein DFI_14025 [Deinococcus ficus]